MSAVKIFDVEEIPPSLNGFIVLNRIYLNFYNPQLNLTCSNNNCHLSQTRLKYFWSAPRVRMRSFGRYNDKFQQQLKKLTMRRMFQLFFKMNSQRQ